jgi:hypothetical protein
MERTERIRRRPMRRPPTHPLILLAGLLVAFVLGGSVVSLLIRSLANTTVGEVQQR